ncbi:MAG: histidinol-phosphate transaminase [Planctomycetota bacterium]|nr:histidinol-phosphate transaminase [Planctomycetota bacterium]MCX8040352.1 histidinol-phosphate transaminase [Planctomycetota bacterium]MDW8373808.1 histidinol-phosphate transaminase [Planctomycetota bacterium]
MSEPPRPAPRQVRPAIRAMRGYTPGEQAIDCVKLNTNESAWPPSPRVHEVLRAVADDHLRLYPDPRAERLRAAAAEVFGVPAEAILAGNGSDDCLTILFRTLLDPGDRVACPWPTYGLYDELAAIQGVAIEHVDWARDWRLPSVLPRLGAKLLILANPNNPSGTVVPVAELRRLADAHDGILAVDEAYVDFCPGASLLPCLAAHPNLVVLRSFSKSYALAGARLGLMFAAPALIEQCMKVKDSYNVNRLTQELGLAALADREHHRQLVERTLAERARLERELAAFGWQWPESGANFLFCRVGEHAGELYRALKARGILVRWWDRPQLREHLRISVGTPAQSDRLLAALRALLAP